MNEFSEIKHILKNQDKKLDDIHFAIFGSKDAGIKGISHIVQEHSKAISEYKKFKWIAAGATMGGWTGFALWIKNHFGL